MGLVWNLIELISIVRFGPNWNENGPGLKFSFTLRPRTNPCVVTSGSKPGSTRPTRRRLHATGATAALTRPARRRRTAPTTTLPAAFSPVRICSLPSLSYPLLSLPQTLALDLAPLRSRTALVLACSISTGKAHWCTPATTSSPRTLAHWCSIAYVPLDAPDAGG
jgi:hypothetical protein